MDIKYSHPKTAQILKIAGIVIVAAFVLSFAARLIFAPAYYGGRDYGPSAYPESAALPSRAEAGKSLFIDNVLPPPELSLPTPGEDAEEYEVTEYRGQIETTNKGKTCGAIFVLKEKEYVIFESANDYDKGCNYTFKVERERAGEILTIINELKPRELAENSYTIKRQIDDYSSSIAILEKQQKSIEETLKNAIAAYDDITRLANRTGDVESLAKIIDSKIGIIERLTEKRLAVGERLDQLARAKAEQLDRLKYTYFYLTVYEQKYVDWKQIKDIWKIEVQIFVQDVNRVAQNLSLGLVRFAILGFQYVLYAFLILLVVKYGWRAGRYVWKK